MMVNVGWVRRRWPVVLVAGWGALLLVLAIGGFTDDATVREHRGVVAARKAVNQAAVAVIRAAGPDAAVRVSRYEFAGRCEISLVRDGAMHRRRIDLYTRPGEESALLAELARRLPARYRAEAYALGDTRRLAADGDGFVTIEGSTSGGVVRVELATGCRPVDGILATLRTPPSPTERDRVNEVLELVEASRQRPRWRTESVGCGGAEVRAVELTVAEPPDRPLADAADLAPPDATLLVKRERLLAYRQGKFSVVVHDRDGKLTLTTTAVGC